MGELPFDGYIRVSRVGDRVDRLRSPEFQEREIRREARQRGLRVGRVISDLDQSGGRDDRPGLLDAIERIEAGESGGIVVAKLDRFSRNLTQATALAERIMSAGGRIFSYAEPADWTTSDGELQINLALAIAQHQRRRANEYFESAKAAAVERGVPINPRIAPGYRRDADTGRLVIDERVAPVIREVFELRIAGAGPAAIADHLQVRDVRTSMGSATWSKQAVYGMLANRVYIGELRYAGYVNAGSHTPIIDRATWEAAQRQPARLPSLGTQDPFLLTGLVRCWACRHALHATRTSRRKPIYRCTRRHAGVLCPDPARIDASVIDEYVTGAFLGQLESGLAMQPVTDSSAIDEAQATLLTTELELAQYRDDLELREVIGRDSWLDGLRARRAAVEAAEAALGEARLDMPQRTSELHALAEDFPTMAVADQREALARLIDCVALRSRTSAASTEDRVVVFWAGFGPRDLPRRGFREQPQLRPFELPPLPAVLAA